MASITNVELSEVLALVALPVVERRSGGSGTWGAIAALGTASTISSEPRRPAGDERRQLDATSALARGEQRATDPRPCTG